MKQFLLFLIFFPALFFSQTQIGQDINGNNPGDESGRLVCISNDGSTIAVSSNVSFNAQNISYVKVYRFINNNWIQIGQDLNEEGVNDRSGIISLSADGNIVAIGAPLNDGVNGANSGHARVFEYINNTWMQIGDDIDGEVANDWSGYSVSLSSDGSIIAVGSYQGSASSGFNTYSGHVKIYENVNGEWIQLGQNIDGEAPIDLSGTWIDLSSDGTIIAIGAQLNDGINGNDSGHVRLYEYSNNVWTQIGDDLDGEAPGDSFSIVSLSSNGNIVAIGGPLNDGINGENSGHVRVFENVNNSWTQIGDDIDGEAPGDYFGFRLCLSGDGTILAIGAPFYDGVNGENSGQIKIYQNIGDNWTEIGTELEGDAMEDNLSSVYLSEDATRLVTGNPKNDNINGEDSGRARVYSLNSVLSVNSILMTQFDLYPNPTKGKFVIQLQQGIQLKHINVYNYLGQNIMTSNDTNIDLSKVSSGIYFIEVNANNGKMTKKIIKE